MRAAGATAALLLSLGALAADKPAAGNPNPPFWYQLGCYDDPAPGRTDPRNHDRLEGYRVLWENDLLSGHRTLTREVSDRWYTNGLKFITLQCRGTPAPARHSLAPFRPIEWILPEEGVRQYGHTFGQLMFTPGDIGQERAQPDDRFWAGYLFFGSVAQVEKRDGHDPDRGTLATAEVDLGLIGHQALSGDVQRSIHSWFDKDRPMGWGNQMNTEPTFNLHYLRMHKTRPVNLPLGAKADLTPHYGFAAGTVFDYLNAGATFRIGNNLGSWPAGTIDIPSLAGTGSPARTSGWGFGSRVNLFFRFDMRLTAYNAFVDGGFLRGDPHPSMVRHKPLTLMFNRGLSFEHPGMRLTLFFNRRSSEFNNAPGSRSTHSFATLNVEIEFDRAKD